MTNQCPYGKDKKFDQLFLKNSVNGQTDGHLDDRRSRCITYSRGFSCLWSTFRAKKLFNKCRKIYVWWL